MTVAALVGVLLSAPLASHANPFSKLLKSVKIQRGNPGSGAGGSPAVGSGGQASPAAPVAATPAPATPRANEAPYVPTGHSRCQPGLSGAGLTKADSAAVQKITTSASQTTKVDLNGDEKPDFFIVDSANCGTAGCVTDVYLWRDGAYQNVFSTELQADVEIGAGSTNGMCDLVSEGTRYAWNGKTYASQGAAPTTKRSAEARSKAPSQPLASYAGKKGFSEIVLAEPALENAFQKLLGDGYADFINHFTISDSAVVEQGYLIGDGCQVHNCDSEFAVGAVRIKDRALFGAILSPTTGPKFKVFASHKGALPRPVTARMEHILTKHQLWPTPPAAGK